MTGKLFKIGRFAELCGVTQRTITHYMEKGLLIPEKTPERRGLLNKFSERNFYELLLIRELVQHNFGLDDVKMIVANRVRVLRSDGTGKEILVIYDGHSKSGKAVPTTTGPDGVIKLNLNEHKSATVIDLTGLRERAKELSE